MAKKGKAAVAEPEEDLELEDLDEDVEEEKPSKGKGKKAAEEVTFGASDLAKLASEVTGKNYDARAIRQLLRKMAREETPRINREIVPGNKSRYNWSGPDDPEVKAVLKAIKGGEIETAKKEALDKLKADKAKKSAKKGKKGKATKAAEPEELEEITDLEDDDDE